VKGSNRAAAAKFFSAKPHISDSAAAAQHRTIRITSPLTLV
jgi:hypothetical protein